jgi:putative ABC transport system permease protein
MRRTTSISMTVVYLSARERMRKVAEFKAIGVPKRSVLASLVFQAVVVAVLAAAVGIALSLLLAPILPMAVHLVPVPGYVALPTILIALGLLGGFAGLLRNGRR